VVIATQVRRAALLAVAGAALLVPATAAASPAGGAGRAGLRWWHGTLIRPLDPPLARASGHAAAVPRPGESERLSDERADTRWAQGAERARITARPVAGSRRVARVRLFTEDGFPEIYLALRRHWDAQGREWIQVRVPMRPNGRVGWVPRAALGRLHLTHKLIVVDRARLRISLRVDGRKVWSAPVAVGAHGTPTPAGHFWIRERFKLEDPRSGYYPYAFGTADYSTLSDWPGGGVVGIHGPYFAAARIPGRISHGCIRLKVRDDRWLAHHIAVGTPLRVH
jgi:hypothetical protein